MSEPFTPEMPVSQIGNNYHHTPLLAGAREHNKIEEPRSFNTKHEEVSSTIHSTNGNFLPPPSQYPRFTEPPKPFEPSAFGPSGSTYNFNHRPPISLKVNQNNSSSKYTFNELPPLTRPHLPVITQSERVKDSYEYKPYSFANLLHPDPRNSQNNSVLSGHIGERLDQVLPQPYANKYNNKEVRNESINSRHPINKRNDIKSNNLNYQCKVCNKSYKTMNCLTKHEWEHDPNWKEVAKLALPKSQQVQLMEAAQTLIDISRSQRSIFK